MALLGCSWLIVGGITRRWRPRIVFARPAAPAAPMRCPTCDLTALIAIRWPRRQVRAEHVSHRVEFAGSPTGVPAPCVSMNWTVAGE